MASGDAASSSTASISATPGIAYARQYVTSDTGIEEHHPPWQSQLGAARAQPTRGSEPATTQLRRASA